MDKILSIFEKCKFCNFFFTIEAEMQIKLKTKARTRLKEIQLGKCFRCLSIRKFSGKK